MKEAKFEFQYKVYDSIDELPEEQQMLLNKAKEATDKAYAPYSKFKVGAIAKLANGETISGTNQENASFPVGLCAERVLLSSLSSLYPNVGIDTIAISYKSENQVSDHPVSPCGICRQSLQEFESRVNHPIQLVLGGLTGPVYVIKSAGCLLPLAFTSEELT
ncbi:MAG: cytidine deaminase [Bacteroidota bacterium]|jgi:cytidine deaminase|nr:cytidine deaminase [Flavisolibacter sp.]MDQ3551611.1 cytidine deaminase [Bacteroidota bacterium]